MLIPNWFYEKDGNGRPSRFTEKQIVSILKQQENGIPTKYICRKHGISEATFYKWNGAD